MIGALLGVWTAFNFLISIVAMRVIPYLGFFSYHDSLDPYRIPDVVKALANFDGIFFIRIALHGYADTEQAYFPLYPLILRLVHYVISDPVIAGVLISYFCFLIGFIVFNKYIHTLMSDEKCKWVLGFLLLYPTSYYFGVMYTESLFFVLFISALYQAKKGNLMYTAICAYFVALTRVIGVFIVFPLFSMLIMERITTTQFNVKKIIQHHWKDFIVCTAPVLGIATYMIYLWYTKNDPLYFFHAQEQFGAHRSSHLISPPQVLYRYFKIFVTASRNFQYWIAVSELCFYLFALGLLSYDLIHIWQKKSLQWERLGLHLFSLCNVVVPSLTGTLTAVPRYTLMSLSLFLILAEIENKCIKYAIASVFTILHIVMYSLFIQGYYVT